MKTTFASYKIPFATSHNQKVLENAVDYLRSKNRIAVDNSVIYKVLSSNRECNCWGFTSLLMKWINTPEWLDYKEMSFWLENRTKEITSIKQLRAGDIISYWDNGMCWFTDEGKLNHTAVVLSKKNGEILCIHKPGTMRLEIGTHKHILGIYYYCTDGQHVKFHRVIE